MTATRRRRAGDYHSASEWPSWADELRYGIGPSFEPTPSDRQWAARELGRDDNANDQLPDELMDRMAEEQGASDELERGLRMY